MQGCIAPSEIPGVTSGDASVFGAVAEDLIFADFCRHYTCSSDQVFWDDHNPAAYLYFLARHNPSFTESVQRTYFTRVREEDLMRVPDILVHNASERAFYEIKPDSRSGLRAGTEKVGTLGAVYRHFGLPYTAGTVYTPAEHVVAQLGSSVRVTLQVRRVVPGLILYKLCLRAEGLIEFATLAVLLRLIVREINRQRGSGRFEPVDLEPVFRGNQQLADLARVLGLGTAAAATAVVAVRWRHFWKAVARRFALRGATAAALAAADGPLPIGDLVAVGLSIWTIVDIVRLSDELWRDAAMIARNEI